MVLRKNRLLFFLTIAAILLVLLLISSSKVLTIKSEKNNPKNDVSSDQTISKSDEVKKEYEKNLIILSERLQHYIGEYEKIYLVESKSDELADIEEKIKELRDEFTSLLVPPDYRVEHLNLVLGFQRNDFEKMSESEYLSACKDTLENIKNIKK